MERQLLAEEAEHEMLEELRRSNGSVQPRTPPAKGTAKGKGKQHLEQPEVYAWMPDWTEEAGWSARDWAHHVSAPRRSFQ